MRALEPRALTFELPDPDPAMPRIWRIHALHSGEVCDFSATSGDERRDSRWQIAPDVLGYRREIDSPLSSEQLFHGFLRLYRRRFRKLVDTPDPQTFTWSDIQQLRRDFEPVYSDADVTAQIIDELEVLLTELAECHHFLTRGDDSQAIGWELPSAPVWRSRKRFVTGGSGALSDELRSGLAEFHRGYAATAQHLASVQAWLRHSLEHLQADIADLTHLGARLVWEFYDQTPGSGSAVKAIARHQPASPWPRDEAIHIAQLSLSNIRRFLDIELQLRCPDTCTQGQWLLFLGDNGTGKTTLLRAITLTLLDNDFAQSFMTRFSSDAPMIATGARDHATDPDNGAINLQLQRGDSRALKDMEVVLTGMPERERMTLKRTVGHAIPVFAYGCRRGSALGGPERDIDIRQADDAATLFDPNSYLIHADAWLRKLAYASDRNAQDKLIFSAVKNLLEDPDDDPDALLPGVRRIDIASDRTWVVRAGGERVPLTAMSDGYLTTLGWLIDFLARWLAYARRHGYKIEPDFQRRMPALVVIDELDLHLHPRWQTRVVSALAKNFPQTSFIATTHNPLTLNSTVLSQQMRGSVHIIHEHEPNHERKDGRLTITKRDLPAGMRVDEVLTGRWFGLDTAVDADTQAKLEEHRLMLRQGIPETNPERLALETVLRQRLGRFADTSAERLAQTLVAQEFPDGPPATTRDPQKLKHLRRLYAASLAEASTDSGSEP